MSNFTASDVLLKAASRIEEEGMWCQGRFFADIEVDVIETAFVYASQARSDRVAECAMGALMSATVELGLRYDDYSEAARLLEVRVLAEANDWISCWNDEPGRSAVEVAEMMRRAVDE